MFEGFPNLHPLVVHVPIVLIMLAAALQGILVFRDWPPVRWITLGVMAGGFAGALAASTVFHAMPMGLPSKAAAMFAEHEQYAGYTLWLSGITLLLGGVGAFFQLKQRAYEILVLVSAVAAAGVLSVAGHRGAQLVYVAGVGPQGNMMMKGDHHGHGGAEAMPGMNMETPTADAHGQEAGHSDDGHDGPPAAQKPMPPNMEGMDMGRAASPKPARPAANDMGGVAMPGQKNSAPAGQANRADMPGMNRKPGRPMPPGQSRSGPPAPMDMGSMPGMDMRPPAAKNAPRPAAGRTNNMNNMNNMADMPGMKPTGQPKPAPAMPGMGNRKGMDGQPNMPDKKNIKGMGEMKGMDDAKAMPGMGSMPGMPGMAMPNPMDKYRFQDNNPAREQPKQAPTPR